MTLLSVSGTIAGVVSALAALGWLRPRRTDLCEHQFVGIAGSASVEFERACKGGLVYVAFYVSRELPQPLTLGKAALDLVVLLARTGDERFDRVAVRWLERLAGETPVTVAGMRAAADALSVVALDPDDRSALAILRSLASVRRC